MTIDELFYLPICELSNTLTKMYKEPKGYYKNEYWFTDLKETFGIEFPEGCGWRIIPCQSGYKDDRNNMSALDKIKRTGWGDNTLNFAVTKISKYGECLTYELECKLYDTSHRDMNLHKWVNSTDIELVKISYNNNCDESRVYIDGPDIVNNSEIGVHYQLGASNDYTNKWVEKYDFIDKYDSIEFSSKPIVNAIERNKHSLNEFAIKLEKFAKNVVEVVRPVYNENKNIIEDSDFNNICKKHKAKPQQIFDIWLACYVMNQNTKIEDIFGMIRLHKAKESIITDYLTKCKCAGDIYDYNGNLDNSYSSYHCYDMALLYGRTTYTRVDLFVPLAKNLDKTRELYNSLDNYKDTLKKAKEEYKTKYDIIASEFEANITYVYNKIREDLETFKNTYSIKDNELYEEIHKKYPNITDTDLGVYETDYNILDNLLKEINKTAIKLKKNLNSSYKNDIISVSNKKEGSKKNTDEEFKLHCKKLFDVAKDLKKIIYYSVHKAYDAPYEIYEVDYLDEKIPDSAIYEYEEKYGENSFNEWLDKFDVLRPSVSGDYRSLGSDLYPGEEYNLFVNRKLEYDGGNEYTG